MRPQNFNEKMFQAKYFNMHIYLFAVCPYNTSVVSIPFHSNPFGLHTFPLQVASGNYLKFKVHDLHAEFASLDSVCQICFWKSKQNVKG